MEYIAAALEARGHDVTIADLRFLRPAETFLSRLRPGLVGIAGMHALETADVAGAGGGASVYRTTGETGTLQLDEVPRPARHQVASWAHQYACLAHRPTSLIETARAARRAASARPRRSSRGYSASGGGRSHRDGPP